MNLDPLRLLVDLYKLHLSKILALIAIANKTWIKSFKRSSRSPQKVNLGTNLKAKTLNVYYGRSHIEYYNFCQ